jgi:hypothetical protein
VKKKADRQIVAGPLAEGIVIQAAQLKLRA